MDDLTAAALQELNCALMDGRNALLSLKQTEALRDHIVALNRECERRRRYLEKVQRTFAGIEKAVDEVIGLEREE